MRTVKYAMTLGVSLVITAFGLASTQAVAATGAAACVASTFTGFHKKSNRPLVKVEGATITQILAQHNPTAPLAGTPAPAIPFCEVEVLLTHGVEADGALPQDEVRIWVWLPDNWNGRFVTLGGGGTIARANATAMGASLVQGYAVATSDSGVLQAFQPNIFVQQGKFNWQLFENWSYRGVHDSAVASKAVTQAYYLDTKPAYSYWSGCSNGGRQGLEMAQRFPEDYDGVMSAAPAIYAVARQNLSISWPVFLQNDAFGANIATCKRNALTAAVVAACDANDAVVDQLISDPKACNYSAALESTGRRYTGELHCDYAGRSGIAKKIIEGPHTPDGRFIWYGYPPGAGVPTNSANFWIQNFLLQDLTFDYRTSNTDELLNKWYPMAYNNRLAILEGSHPVPKPFADRGGKVLMWHGLADSLVPPEQSEHYWKEVAHLSGNKTKDFFRLFMAPGVGHCGGGTGPSPVDPLAALVGWVENGVAPNALPAERLVSGVLQRARNLCPFPQVQVYQGGDINAASSFVWQTRIDRN